MRKVTEKVMSAFLRGESCTVGNTSTDGQDVWLHGNRIATRDPEGGYMINFCGWNTPTTRERINGLEQLYRGTRSYHQRNFELYCNDHSINENYWYTL